MVTSFINRLDRKSNIMFPIDLKNLPTHRQSDAATILGILTIFLGLYFIFSNRFLEFVIPLLTAVVFISLGTRRVIDQDYFIIYLKELIKKEIEK